MRDCNDIGKALILIGLGLSKVFARCHSVSRKVKNSCVDINELCKVL